MASKAGNDELQRAISEMGAALDSLRESKTADTAADVEAHRSYYSDENLKQAIQQVESALDALRQVAAQQEDDADVEAHRSYYSDESLKQAIQQLEKALRGLTRPSTASR